MKKFKTILIIILLFIVIYFLQINFFTWFNIGGIMPNLFVVLVLFLGLFIGEKLGVVFGLLFGIILDFTLGKTIGPSAILLAIIGYLGEYFDRNFSKDNRIMIMLMGIGSTIFYELGMYIVNIVRFKIEIEPMDFIFNLLIEIVFNVLLIIIFHPWIKKLGYYLEDNYKGKKFLTRYF